MPRPSNTDERQSQITRALLKVMAKKGYDGASIADIAKAARLAPGLVHYHFKSKQQILLAALARLVATHDDALDVRLASVQGDAAASVAAFIDFHLGLGADADAETLKCWILFSGEALRDAKVRAPFDKALQATADRLAAVITQGVEARVFVCDGIRAAACALVAVIQGYFVLAATTDGLIPKGSAAAATKRMAAGLLGHTKGFPAEGRTK